MNRFAELALLACTIAWTLAGTTACDAGDSASGNDGSTGTGIGGDDSTGAPSDVGTPEPTLRCPTPEGHTGRPRTIAEVLAHIEALPAPVDVPCVLESFGRPLPLLATSSPFSAQPGQGDANPRLFVFFDGLIVSFATVGYGSNLIEFAEFVGPTTTVKAEIAFPLEPDALDLAFRRVLDEGSEGTICRLCHRNERPADEVYAGAFASDALAPRADTILALDDVRAEAAACDPTDDAQRCAIFDAVFVPGEVIEGSFDPRIQTIFDYE